MIPHPVVGGEVLRRCMRAWGCVAAVPRVPLCSIKCPQASKKPPGEGSKGSPPSCGQFRIEPSIVSGVVASAAWAASPQRRRPPLPSVSPSGSLNSAGLSAPPPIIWTTGSLQSGVPITPPTGLHRFGGFVGGLGGSGVDGSRPSKSGGPKKWWVGSFWQKHPLSGHQVNRWSGPCIPADGGRQPGAAWPAQRRSVAAGGGGVARGARDGGRCAGRPLERSTAAAAAPRQVLARWLKRGFHGPVLIWANAVDILGIWFTHAPGARIHSAATQNSVGALMV